MKRKISLLLSVILIFTIVISGCEKENTKPTEKENTYESPTQEAKYFKA